MSEYNLYDEFQRQATFTLDGTASDPGTVTFWMQTPDGAETSYVYGTDSELTKEGTGVYLFALELTQAGVHRWRFAGSSPVSESEEGRFTVRPSVFYD